MEFWKMNGAGNDFIVVDDRQDAIPDEKWPEIIRTVCERHMSIGADGFMVVKKPTYGGDYKMLFFNSDGSMGEMCGNGARCICRYGYENGLAGEVQKVETTAGLVTGWRVDRRLYRVRLNDPCNMRLDGKAEVDGATYDCAYVELGDPGIPHAVLELPDWDALPEEELSGVAMAFINARLDDKPDTSAEAAVDAAAALRDVTGLIEKTMKLSIDRSSFNYARFATHFQYLVERINSGGQMASENVSLAPSLREEFPAVADCVEAIAGYFQTRWSSPVNEEEKMYLILHVNRICQKQGL